MAGYVLKCRCRRLHPIPAALEDCLVCGRPTIDAHRICGGKGCRVAEDQGLVVRRVAEAVP